MIKSVMRRLTDKFERNWKHGVGHLGHKIATGPRAAWLFSRGAARLACILAAGIGLAAPAVAFVSAQPAAVRFYTMSPGRIGGIVAGVVGLIGAVIGGRALSSPAGRISAADRRRGAIVALILGPIGLVIGGLVVATAKGGLGTGNGLGGGVVAMIIGLIGMTVGWMALARARRTV
jgi:hypothetical protein